MASGSGGGLMGVGGVGCHWWRLFPCRGDRDVVDVVAVGLMVSRGAVAGAG